MPFIRDDTEAQKFSLRDPSLVGTQYDERMNEHKLLSSYSLVVRLRQPAVCRDHGPGWTLEVEGTALRTLRPAGVERESASRYVGKVERGLQARPGAEPEELSA